MFAANHAQSVLSSLNQQRAVGKFCDAALNVGGGVVYLAHRNILACFSELFQESSVSPAPTMDFSFQECPCDGIELLLNFVYTGELKLDLDNVSKVQHAATTLCVQEALQLCHQFKEKSVKAVPYKRKRGRPRKSDTDTSCCSVTDENLLTVTKEESCTDGASLSAATTTTTRSGRLVKGPRRLVTDESAAADVTVAENTNKRALLTDKASGDVDSPNADQPTGEPQGNEIKTNDNGISQVIKEDDDGDHERINDDSDEEYVPLPGSSAASITERSRSDKTANGKKVDSKKDSVQCHVCDKSFKSKYYLKVHNRRHTGEKPFVCLKCGKRYFRKENLVTHEFKNCTRAKTYTCSTCSLMFKGKEELRVHITSHTGDMPYKCSTCPEQFVYKKNLTHHMMKVHGHAKPHACPECPKAFLSRSELRVHEAAKHRGEKPFVCEECGHRASSRNGLQMHIKAIHRNERPFVCNVCGHAFSQKNNLNMHLRVHSGERPYQCHFCGKTFRTQGSLDKHHRTHTGERPFSCDVCEQRFTEKGALLRHKASKHEEGRPHGCNICSKTFKAKEQLRVHLRRHKGMRKFECANCGYKFTRQAHLRRHVQIHKRTENYNPRQRKLRNVIVQEVDGSTSQNEEVEASLITEGAEFVHVVQEPTEPETGLGSTCVVRVMIDAAEEEDDEAACGQNLGHMEAMQSFSVPEVLQQTQLVTKAYESTMHMEEIVENMTENSA